MKGDTIFIVAECLKVGMQDNGICECGYLQQA